MPANAISVLRMKWIFLIFSLAFHMLIGLLFIRISRNGSGVPGVFGWFLTYWMLISILAVIVFVLRIFKVVRRNALPYICFGSGSFLLGGIGLFIGIGDINRDLVWLCLYVATIILGLIMLSDALVVNLIDKEK